MKLRYWFAIYLISLHVVFMIPTYIIIHEKQQLLFAVEGFYLISFTVGFILIRFLFKPFDLIATGTELIAEEDFISTLRPIGHRELDRLIVLFNTMLLRLRDERLQTEQQHHFLAKLISAIPSGIVILDYDGRIQSLNHAAENLFGQTTTALAGKPVDCLAEPFQSSLTVLEDDSSVVISYHGNRRLKMYKSRFFDRGFPRTFVLIAELTEEIKASEKAAYETLIRMMSHEINNSVGAVGSLLQSSRNYSDQITVEDRGDFVTAIDVSIARLKNLNGFIGQYANLVHLPQPRFNKTDIVSLLTRCADLFQDESTSKSIRWQWSVGEFIPPIQCDQAQMEQVFINIFRNAMEAIGSDGNISITCHTVNNRIDIRIGDSGGGIPTKVQKQLFTPFFTTKKNGHGIGLTLIGEILERHGFAFSLENDTNGAVFIIEINQ